MPVTALRIALAIALGLSAVPAPAQPAPASISVGFVRNPDPYFYIRTFAPTMSRLRQTMHSRKIISVEVDSAEDLAAAIRSKAVQYVIASSGFYAWAERTLGIRQMAARRRAEATDTNRSSGSAIFVRAGSPIQTLRQLSGKRIASQSPDSFAGWLVAKHALLSAGLEQDRDFSNVRFTRYEFPDVATLVATGQVDAGVLPACELERLYEEGAFEKGFFAVIESKSGQGLSCARSTILYPGSVFAALPSSPAAEVQSITVSLLTMKPTREGYSWGIANDFTGVESAYRQLEIPPFQRPPLWRLVWEQYRSWLWLLAVLALIALVHIVRTNYLVAVRTRELREQMTLNQKAEERILRTQSLLGQVERAGAVAQISSIFAHEVSQPLEGLMNYAEGLRLYVSGRTEDPTIARVCGQIVSLSSRIGAIVDRVRSYAKRKAGSRELCDCAELVDRAVRSFSHYTASEGVQISVDTGQGMTILADPLEIEIVLLNLLKNSAEAIQASPVRRIWIDAHRAGNQAQILVHDSGPWVADALLAALSTPLASGKENGLGLGLHLSRRILETHGGSLAFERSQEGGVLARVRLPLSVKEQEKTR